MKNKKKQWKIIVTNPGSSSSQEYTFITISIFTKCSIHSLDSQYTSHRTDTPRMIYFHSYLGNVRNHIQLIVSSYLTLSPGLVLDISTQLLRWIIKVVFVLRDRSENFQLRSTWRIKKNRQIDFVDLVNYRLAGGRE